jgi:hypothetical protein
MAVMTGIKQFREDFEAAAQFGTGGETAEPALSPAANTDRAEVGR